MAAMMSACALLTSQSPANFKATIVAGSMINPDVDGRPSPVVIQLFELASENEFIEASFSDLYDNTDKTLGKALLARHSIILQPDSSKVITVTMTPRTSAIGVVAGVAQFANVTWRALALIKQRRNVAIRINIDSTGLSVQGSH
jgi:type VI secretion system protein VasD